MPPKGSKYRKPVRKPPRTRLPLAASRNKRRLTTRRDTRARPRREAAIAVLRKQASIPLPSKSFPVIRESKIPVSPLYPSLHTQKQVVSQPIIKRQPSNVSFNPSLFDESVPNAPVRYEPVPTIAATAFPSASVLRQTQPNIGHLTSAAAPSITKNDELKAVTDLPYHPITGCSSYEGTEILGGTTHENTFAPVLEPIWESSSGLRPPFVAIGCEDTGSPQEYKERLKMLRAEFSVSYSKLITHRVQMHTDFEKVHEKLLAFEAWLNQPENKSLDLDLLSFQVDAVDLEAVALRQTTDIQAALGLLQNLKVVAADLKTTTTYEDYRVLDQLLKTPFAGLGIGDVESMIKQWNLSINKMKFHLARYLPTLFTISEMQTIVRESGYQFPSNWKNGAELISKGVRGYFRQTWNRITKIGTTLKNMLSLYNLTNAIFFLLVLTGLNLATLSVFGTTIVGSIAAALAAIPQVKAWAESFELIAEIIQGLSFFITKGYIGVIFLLWLTGVFNKWLFLKLAPTRPFFDAIIKVYQILTKPARLIIGGLRWITGGFATVIEKLASIIPGPWKYDDKVKMATVYVSTTVFFTYTLSYLVLLMEYLSMIPQGTGAIGLTLRVTGTAFTIGGGLAKGIYSIFSAASSATASTASTATSLLQGVMDGINTLQEKLDPAHENGFAWIKALSQFYNSGIVRGTITAFKAVVIEVWNTFTSAFSAFGQGFGQSLTWLLKIVGTGFVSEEMAKQKVFEYYTGIQTEDYVARFGYLLKVKGNEGIPLYDLVQTARLKADKDLTEFFKPRRDLYESALGVISKVGPWVAILTIIGVVAVGIASVTDLSAAADTRQTMIGSLPTFPIVVGQEVEDPFREGKVLLMARQGLKNRRFNNNPQEQFLQAQQLNQYDTLIKLYDDLQATRDKNAWNKLHRKRYLEYLANLEKSEDGHSKSKKVIEQQAAKEKQDVANMKLTMPQLHDRYQAALALTS